MPTDKDFLDTTVVRGLLTGAPQFRKYLDDKISQQRYVSPYVLMEFRRGFLLVATDIFFAMGMPQYATPTDALSVFANAVNDRIVRAAYQVVLTLFTTRKIDLTHPDGKLPAMRAVGDYIDRMNMMLECSFTNTGQDATRCSRAAIELHVEPETMTDDIRSFVEEFTDEKACASRCSMAHFVLEKNRTAVDNFIAHAEKLTADRQKTKNKEFIQIAEHLSELSEKGAKACTCKNCAMIGDAVIAVDVPKEMKLNHTDNSFNQLCDLLGKPHFYLSHEHRYFKDLGAVTEPADLG